MKHMWKKNQIIITALAALVAVAGYLNYSGTKLGENALPASTTETEATLTDIDSLDQDITLTDSADGEVYLGEAAAGETDGMSDGHCIRRSDRHAGRGSTYQHRNRQQLCGPGKTDQRAGTIQKQRNPA